MVSILSSCPSLCWVSYSSNNSRISASEKPSRLPRKISLRRILSLRWYTRMLPFRSGSISPTSS
ncbi:hypothetical protein VCHENC01_3741 [Vibrio harveyi]|nr:hypothetical protein VCHENC01_3741 [Vibrio harveyi]